MQRKPVIGVMGGSKATKKVADMATSLGALIARKGWVLLTGGRDCGVMAASARGAKEAGGTVIGVLPDISTKKASPHLDYAIVTGLGDYRNLINVLSSDVVVAFPGAWGTLSEVVFALKRDIPLILLGWRDSEDLQRRAKRGRLFLVDTPEEAVSQAQSLLAEQWHTAAPSRGR
jgi:hypothetical protein